jgi:arylsulfatase
VNALGLFLIGLTACATNASNSNSPPNVLLISIDTLRADRVGKVTSTGNSLTPSIDSFSSESLVFQQAYSQSNESLFSHASLMTGQMPSSLGPLNYLDFRLNNQTPTLANVLSEHGYRTEGIVGGGHLSAAFGLQAGFDRYTVMDNFSGFQQSVPKALDALERFHEEPDEPFFLFVHGYDCHSPYTKPGPAARLSSPEYNGPFRALAREPITYEQIYYNQYAPDFRPGTISTDTDLSFISTEMFEQLPKHIQRNGATSMTQQDVDYLIGTYDDAVRYADMWVGILLANLEARGFSENTIVILVADHGEDLLDHGYFNHRVGLFDETLHVPMMIRAPGQAPAIRSEPVGIFDVFPTVLGLLNQSWGETTGVDLLQSPQQLERLIPSESAQGERSVRNNTHRLNLESPVWKQSSLPTEQPYGAVFMTNSGEPTPWLTSTVRPLWSTANYE